MMRGDLKFVAGLVVFAAATVALSLLAGSLRITGHEGDILQALDAAGRLNAGQLQHIDFMTPLGVLATAPIAWAQALGFGPGMSVLVAQALVCVAVLPLVLMTVQGRLNGRLRIGFAIAAVLMVTALAYGGSNPSTSLAMYYNRWAWVLAAMAVIVLMVPSQVPNAARDGIILGVCAAALTLLKVTYLIGLLPFALVAILTWRAWKTFAVALIVAGLLLLAATLAFGGLAFWKAYLGDLLATAASPMRSRPGEEFGSLLGKPAYLPASLAALTAVVFWRKTRRQREGLLMLLLFPGLVFITYQNWGNDPVWLVILAIVLLAIPAPENARQFWGVEAQAFGKVLALVCLVFISPSLINLAGSVPRHFGQGSSEFAPMFAEPYRADILVRRDTHNAPSAGITIPGISFAEPSKDKLEPELVLLNGEELPQCDMSSGLVGWLRQLTADIEATGQANGKQVMLADLLDPLWLFGDFQKVEHGAPWYYGGLAGWETADYLAVPLCPLSTKARSERLKSIQATGDRLIEVARTDLVILLEKAD